MEVFILILGMVAGVAGIGSSVYFWNIKNKAVKKLKDKKVEQLSEEDAIVKASAKAKSIILDAKNESFDIKQKTEENVKKQFEELDEREKRLNDREQKIITRSNILDQRFDKLEARERSLEQGKKDVRGLKEKLEKRLEEIAALSREQAKKELMVQVSEDLKDEIAKKIKEAEFEIQAESDEKAKEILVDSMLKSATDYVAETTTTTIEIDKEEMKGKIIGKEGRNIRSFERLTGVDIIVDEAPEAVTLSSFDPIRREIASIALQKLLKDGRVHPGTIEKTIEKVKEDIAREILKTGEKLAYDSGFNNLPPEIIRLLGRFKYRYSYGQNLVKHTLEMVNLGASLAAELGADVMLVKKACLLHDIGKVLVHEIEGKPHHFISGDIIRKYIKDEKLANAAESHHGDVDPKSIEAVIVQIADQISGARPGARRDNYEEYVKRIRALEDIAKKHKGVKEAYGIHAGREVRVIVKPDELTDKEATILAHKIRKEIEDTQQYPGTVKVTVIRELRIEEEAK